MKILLHSLIFPLNDFILSYLVMLFLTNHTAKGNIRNIFFDTNVDIIELSKSSKYNMMVVEWVVCHGTMWEAGDMSRRQGNMNSLVRSF